MDVFWIVLLSLFLIFQIEFLSKVLKFVIYSPTYLYVIFSITTIVLSTLYFYFYPLEKKISLLNLDYIKSKELLNIIKFYLIGINSFIFGVLVYHSSSLKETRKLFSTKFKSSISINVGNKNSLMKIASFLLVTILILFIIGYGLGIFYREEYIPKDQFKAVIMLIKVSSLILCLFLGLLHKFKPSISNLYFFILIILTLGTGSRIAFIFIMLYALLIHNFRRKSLINNLRFIANIVLGLFFFAYLIQLRGLDSHGLIPYFGYVFESFDEILEYFMFNLYYVLIFGVFVSVRTVKDNVVDWDSILISINPLPGSMVGWYDYYHLLRVNIFTPFSSNGEVFTMGIMFTIIFYLIIGVIFGFLEKHFRKLLIEGKKFPALILLLLIVLHILYGFEYNLRSTIRYIYYALFALMMFKLIPIIRKSIVKKS